MVRLFVLFLPSTLIVLSGISNVNGLTTSKPRKLDRLRRLYPTFQINPQIRLETAPLIGGPSWLPVHCRVVVSVGKNDVVQFNSCTTPFDRIESSSSISVIPSNVKIYPTEETVVQQQQQQQKHGQNVIVCDYIPKNPTSANTLKSMLMLQSVPAQVRVQSKVMMKRQEPQHDYEHIMNDSSGDVHNDSISNTVTFTNDVHKEQPLYHRHSIEDFCREYETNHGLHLVHNNCWTFAFQFIRFLMTLDNPAQITSASAQATTTMENDN